MIKGSLKLGSLLIPFVLAACLNNDNGSSNQNTISSSSQPSANLSSSLLSLSSSSRISSSSIPISLTSSSSTIHISTFSPFNPDISYGTLIDSRDGQVYKTVKIGNQTWMAQNLNYGAMVLGNNNQSNDSQTEKYCYDNNPTNCSIFGAYYQWAEVMNLPSICDTTDCATQIQPKHQGICPTGWHVPSDTEWKTLELAIGMTQAEVDSVEVRGDVAKKLKSKEAWVSEAGLNTLGFSVLPSGSRTKAGIFANLGVLSLFWTSSQAYYANYGEMLTKLSVMGRVFDSQLSECGLDYENLCDKIERNNLGYWKEAGFSLRCIKN